MKKHLTFALIAGMILSLTHCDRIPEQELQYGKVVVAGKILNLDKHPDHVTLRLYFRDLLNRPHDSVVFINEDGSFHGTTAVAYTSGIYLIYGNITSLFCSPGDSLWVEIDADIWDNVDKKIYDPVVNGKYYCRVTGGTVTRINEDLSRYQQELPKEPFIYEKAYLAVKTKNPDEYKAFIRHRDSIYRAFTKNYYARYKPDKRLRELINLRLKYRTPYDLIRYPWVHTTYNNIPRDSFPLPAGYYSFLDTITYEVGNIIPHVYTDFIHEYKMYYLFQKMPDDSVKILDSLYHKKDYLSAYLTSIRHLARIPDRPLRDLVLAQYYYWMLSANLLEDFEKSFDPHLISSGFLKDELIGEYNKLTALLDNPVSLKDLSLISYEKNIVQGLLDTILLKYKGKVIYMDFWAPWCGPCLGEMPNSRKLQQEYKEQDVVFLFLASHCTEKSWKTAIAREKMTGDQILLTNRQEAVFKKMFGISGIPHYALIDKRGRIVNPNAPRPGSDEIRKVLDKLLQ